MSDNFLKDINLNIRFVNFLEHCNSENHKLPWRRLYDYEILFVTDGEIMVRTKTETYSIGKNQLHIMPPFVYHTRFFEKDMQCSYFNAHLDFFYNQFDDDFSIDEAYQKNINPKGTPFTEKASWIRRSHYDGLKVPNKINIFDPDTFTEHFKNLYHTFYGDNDSKYILVKARTYELLADILKECKNNNVALFSFKNNHHESAVSNFVSLVERDYPSNINIAEFSSSYGLSKNHFSKIFKKQVGIAPHNYLINYRIEKAKIMLSTGKYYVNEIACKVGYDNVAYFSRLFKEKEGMSPLDFLNSFK